MRSTIGSGPEGERGTGRHEVSGKELLITKLVEIQQDIISLDTDVMMGKEGASIKKLEKLCKAYNQALAIIFGKRNAQRLDNYMVEDGMAIPFVPDPEDFPISRKKKKKKRKDRMSDLREFEDFDAQPDIQQVLEDGASFDDKHVKTMRGVEHEILFGDTAFLIETRDDIPKGTGYVFVTNPLTKRTFQIPFRLTGPEVEFIKQTLDLYHSSGFSVGVLYNTSDYNRGKARPLDESKARWN